MGWGAGECGKAEWSGGYRRITALVLLLNGAR